jgi:hypothetical protein
MLEFCVSGVKLLMLRKIRFVNLCIKQCCLCRIRFVKETLSNLGISEYFHLQKVNNIYLFKSIVKLIQHYHFLQNWLSTIDKSSKCLVYRSYKILTVFKNSNFTSI